MKEQRHILVVVLELGKKKVAGVGEDVGRGGGCGAGTGRRRHSSDAGAAAAQAWRNGRFYGQKKKSCATGC
jgi:hypothetical protein